MPGKLEKNEGFKPFEPLPDIPPAIYFGFDKELKKGPFSLFINIDESIEYPESFLPKVKWQYLIKEIPRYGKNLKCWMKQQVSQRKEWCSLIFQGKCKLPDYLV